MAELVHEYLSRVQKLNASARLAREIQADIETAHQEELLTHPGWEWYRRQVAERLEAATRQHEALALEIVYGNALGDAITEQKMRARGLQAEVHVYQAVLALIRDAAQILTAPEETP